MGTGVEVSVHSVRMRRVSQRDFMRQLVARHGRNREAVCQAYAAGERAGDVHRSANVNAMSPEQYARALWEDGPRKGWLFL